MKKRFFVVGALIGALLLLLIMYGFAQRGGSPAEQGSPITIETGTTGAIIEQVPIEKYVGEPITNICSDRVLKMLPSDRRGEFPEELKKLSRTLRASPYDTESWLRVGNVKHYLDCYEGARDAWEYVLYLSPESVAAAENLGSLYTTDIQNIPLAEKYYRITIRNNSKDIAAYLGLAEVDRIQKKSDQAITVLKERLNLFHIIAQFI